MRRWVFALLLAGCAATGSPTETPASSATGPVAAPVSADDLQGDWVFGSSSEPAPGAVVTCAPDQTMTITPVGATVSTCAASCRTLEQLAGQNDGGHLQLTGTFQGNLEPQAETVDYDLQYNTTTQHLVGTRNGQPFWAAPLVVPGACAVSPTPDSEAS